MSNRTHKIRKYTPADRLQIVRLQRHLWSRDLAVNSEHLRWKYEQNPYVARPLIYMAVHEGEVVGMRGVYGARWQVGEPARDVLAQARVIPSWRLSIGAGGSCRRSCGSRRKT